MVEACASVSGSILTLRIVWRSGWFVSNSPPSCPAMCRASTSYLDQARRGWPGRGPAMTLDPQSASLLAAFRPVGSDRRTVPRPPAAPACLLETLGGALGQRELDAPRAAFGRHGAQVLGAGIDSEGGAAARALELGCDHGSARLDGIGGGGDVGEDAQQPIRVDAEIADERERLAERLPRHHQGQVDRKLHGRAGANRPTMLDA